MLLFPRKTRFLTAFHFIQLVVFITSKLNAAGHKLPVLLLVIYIFISPAAHSQEYGYRHYDVKDGLAGSTVYRISQDKDGFMWFGTETGVSRFDGTHFKNFTIKDGLPDNEIIQVHGDSQGRVWLLPFKPSISYFYKGKIHNQQNDSVLKKMIFDGPVAGICEGTNGNILLYEVSNLYLIKPSNATTLLKQFPKYTVGKISASDSGYFLIASGHKLYRTDTKTYTFQSELYERGAGGADQMIIHDNLFCCLKTYSILHVKSHLYNIEYDYNTPPVNTIRYINDSVICLNTTKGTIFLNIVRRRIEKRFLINKNISTCLIDKEGGMWFSTFNDGIYHLSSTILKTIKTISPDGQKLGVYGLQKYNDAIWAASDMGYLQEIRNNTRQLISLRYQIKGAERNRIAAITKNSNALVVGSVNWIYLKTPFSISAIHFRLGTIKEIVFKNDTTVIVANSNGIHEFSTIHPDNYKMLWFGRTTCLLYRNDSTYFGTLNGLYLLKPDKTVFFFGDTSMLLQSRISSIKEGENGAIWVATQGNGIIELKGNRITRHIHQDNGLSSSIIRCIGVDTGCIWAGTDKGLNKIDIRAKPVSITRYSSSDGLASDIINTILIDGNTLYAGTPDGIAYFDKRERFPSSVCDLKLLGVYINEKEAGVKNNFNLKDGDNNIRFDYVAISFKAAGDIVYSYRLKGLDTAWKTTAQTSLEFISLPPGKYTLELFATNKFGVTSNIYSAQLNVQAPFWQTAWFVIICVAFSMAVTWLVVAQRNKAIRKKETDERRIEQQLLELEQKALRAQMNPHFIFNCLNSIQEFILDKDVLSANKYLSEFARLIRQTLDNSIQSLISIEDEIKYLKTYLNLEQMRFKNRFIYTIQIDSSMVSALAQIPGMVLQPYIENAIRHGIQNKPDNNGRIDITFSQKDSTIFCTIRDNGVGRKQAQAFRTAQHIEYQSRGMRLTQERIDLMNKNQDSKIIIEIIDQTDDGGIATGTEVMIRFPLIIDED